MLLELRGLVSPSASPAELAVEVLTALPLERLIVGMSGDEAESCSSSGVALLEDELATGALEETRDAAISLKTKYQGIKRREEADELGEKKKKKSKMSALGDDQARSFSASSCGQRI